VVIRTASDWRDFWRSRGERELRLLLWAAWDPIGADMPIDEYDNYLTRIASLLVSRASRDALAAELGRVRTHEMGLEPSPEVDSRVANKIADWFDSV
jgi:hypothetical protein